MSSSIKIVFRESHGASKNGLAWFWPYLLWNNVLAFPFCGNLFGKYEEKISSARKLERSGLWAVGDYKQHSSIVSSLKLSRTNTRSIFKKQRL